MDQYSPAAKARRLRLLNALTGFSFVVVAMVVTVAFDKRGLLPSKNSQLIYTIMWFGLFIAMGIWMAKRKGVVCPRCGWNISFKKSTPAIAFWIPSSCPNCGYDLEKVGTIRQDNKGPFE
jgi:hypothetical protein